MIFQILQHACIVFGHILWGNARDFGHDGLNILGTNRLAPLAFGQKVLGGAGLIDDVDGFVRQFAVVDIAG